MSTSASSGKPTRFEDIQSSIGDQAEYRGIRLPSNRLEVLLISDPQTDKAAAAMDVNVGNFNDPENVPGLAHFLEHMLFLGTAKFPKPNEYQSFLNTHGGQSNAYTSSEHTNYYFDVHKEYLGEALLRFSQFFIAPLFNQEATDRELNAVDSEHAKNLQSDFWRMYQVLKSSAEPGHPFHRFGTGNKDTLHRVPLEQGIHVREQLLRFHEQYYSASVMKLVILGRESLDQLENWAVEFFADIPNHSTLPLIVPENPFPPSSLGKQLCIVPVKDLRTLHIYFQIPPIRHLTRQKPTLLLAHLLGHEGSGSIISLLRTRGWATELSAGVHESSVGFGIFAVSISLSEIGLEKYAEIVRVVFVYLKKMLAADELQWKRIFEEMATISATNFKFRPKQDVDSYCSALCKHMQTYSLRECISGPCLLQEFDYQLLRSFLSKLTQENCFLHLVSQSFDGYTDKVEPWYQTKFRESDMHFLPIDENSAEFDALQLPKPNEFIASDFTLQSESSDEILCDYPELCLQSVSFQLWHKLDNVFSTPKVNLLCLFTCPSTCFTPMNMLLNHLFCKLLTDSLNEYSYDAHLAGLSYELDVTTVGMTLFVQGYHEKLPLLLRKILDRMKKLRIDEDRFQTLRESQSRSFRNFYHGYPYKHAFYYASMCLHNSRWDKRDYLNIIDSVQRNQVEHAGKEFLRNSRVEILAHGNVSRFEAIQLSHSISSALDFQPLLEAQIPQLRVVRLTPGVSYYFQDRVENPAEQNSATLVVLQVGRETYRRRVILDLIHQMASEPCYSQLRTEEQLGYIVGALVDRQRGVLSFKVIIQSSVKHPEYLEERIQAFLGSFEKTLEGLEENEFKKHVSVLRDAILEKDKTLSDESSRHFQEISRHQFLFDRREHEVAALQSITKEEVCEFYGKYISPRSLVRRKLSVYVYGFEEEITEILSDESTVFIEDTVKFKRNMPLYPCFV